MRGLGAGRRTRRSLEKGGTGTAGAFVPHPRLGGKGWVIRHVEGLRDAGATLSWLKKSYETARQIVERENREEP